MYATFGSAITGEVGPTIGPFPFAQMTYGTIRAGDPAGDAFTVAHFDGGLWRIVVPDGKVVGFDGTAIGSVWTDVTLHNHPTDALAEGV